ncbi:MAG: ABC transporter substrate-binding protein, partial [Anaerolineales bacterium]
MRIRSFITVTGLFLVACQSAPEQLDEVVVMLDGVPNTNHTGLVVAQELGYFEELGLQVQVV